MPDFNNWPLPAALSVDQTLSDLTEHADLYIDDDNFDAVFAEAPHLVSAWVSAAARYAAADYQLQMLHRPIEWMRDEVSPQGRWDIDEISPFVDQLVRLLKEHQRLTTAQAEAHRAFTSACNPLIHHGLLSRAERQWRQLTLIAWPGTRPTLVQVPQDACAPWPLVKAKLDLLEQLAVPRLVPEPGRPVIRRALGGFVRLEHDGTWQRLLPDPDGWYWLHRFAWSEPNPDGEQATTTREQPTAA